jgi:hypothetical protein
MAAFFSSCKDYITDDQSLVDTNPGIVKISLIPLPEGVEYFCGQMEYPIWAGQTIDAGRVVISNIATDLYITVESDAGFEDVAENIKIWVGTDLSKLDGGGVDRPNAGHFAFKYTVPTATTSYTVKIPLKDIYIYDVTKCDAQAIYFVVHADVLTETGDQESAQTAFGGNIDPGTKPWWYYDSFTPTCCSTLPPPPSIEKYGTAFAKGGWVFTTDKKSNPEKLPSLNLTNNRWGWAINLISAGTTTYNLWVGAGLNTTSKGKLVGTVTVNFDGAQAIVTYNLSSGYLIEEAHVYAGDFRPTTLAPGLYGNSYYFDPKVNSYSITVDVSDTNGDGIWLIVHAVAWGPKLTDI